MRVLSDVISRILQVVPSGPLRDEFLALQEEMNKEFFLLPEMEAPYWKRGAAIMANHISQKESDWDDTQASIVSIWMGTPASNHPLSHID